MTTVTFLSAQGRTLAVAELKPEQSVMQAGIAAGLHGIEAECGGLLTCATCHVYVAPSDAERLPPPEPDELAMLDFVAAERRDGSRLSCQLLGSPAIDSLTVTLPERQVA
jgi:2Fe-2S ferredoxin